MVKDKDMEFFIMQMVRNMRVNGLITLNMEKQFSQMKTGKL